MSYDPWKSDEDPWYSQQGGWFGAMAAIVVLNVLFALAVFFFR